MSNPQAAYGKPQTILVTGSSGQLGYKIKQLLGKKYDLILTDSEEMDITNQEVVKQILANHKPDFIIHGAAYTKVDQAEEEQELCCKINSEGTKNVAFIAKKIKIPVIYISTDYVFDGKTHTPYKEEDKVNPISIYGASKQKGEEFILLSKNNYVIRVSWLFGELPENYAGSNFVETMIRLGREKDELKIIDDQIGSPTYTNDLVEIIEKIINDKPEHGIYHFSGENPCSWYDFAKKIFELSGESIKLSAINSSEYPQKAKRPKYSYLNKEKIKKALGISVRSWEEMLKEYIKNRPKTVN